MTNGETTNEQSRIDTLFALGNYQTVAETGGPDHWQTFAALGLVGSKDAALEGLSKFDCEEARFYSGAACFIDGDDRGAASFLTGLELPHARRLLDFLKRRRINVLAQITEHPDGAWGLIDGIAADTRFKVMRVPEAPFARVGQLVFLPEPPDFYICAQAEWHLIPVDIAALPCPIFAQTGDPDIHVQQIAPWLSLFDEVITTSFDEWALARGISKRPTSVFPKLFSVSPSKPEVAPGRPRPHDVTITGTWFHPYQKEKARLLHQLLDAADLNLYIQDGYLPVTAYLDLLADSKTVVCFSRLKGCLPPRGLEALSMGCAPIIPKGNAWQLYMNEADGVFTYDPDGDDVCGVIRKIAAEWTEIETRLTGGSKLVKKQFSRARIAETYMRYLTFLAAKPRDIVRKPAAAPPMQKRLVYWRGGNPGGPDLLSTLKREVLARSRPTRSGIIDTARELALSATEVVEHPDFEGSINEAALHGLIERVLGLYHVGMQKFEDSLVMRFNLVRVALHLGNRDQAIFGLKVARETIETPLSKWTVDPMEDVFPYDFFSQFFNYRDYFDAISRHYTQGEPAAETLKTLILASLHHYVGHYADPTLHFSAATRLDPAFFRYAFSQAKALIAAGGPDAEETAKTMLITLAETSWLLPDAYALLKTHWPQDCRTSRRLSAIEKRVARQERTRIIGPKVHRFDAWGSTPLRDIVAPVPPGAPV